MTIEIESPHRLAASVVQRRRMVSCSGVVFLLRPTDLFTIFEEMSGSYLSELELLVLLALIRLGDEAYGVTVSAEIERQTGREAALGSVYATLERLTEKGLVGSELGEPTAERGGRARRYFHPTAKGLDRIRETRQALKRMWRRLPELREENA
jgi:DNA-binding PadR family transcriptional regulator